MVSWKARVGGDSAVKPKKSINDMTAEELQKRLDMLEGKNKTAAGGIQATLAKVVFQKMNPKRYEQMVADTRTALQKRLNQDKLGSMTPEQIESLIAMSNGQGQAAAPAAPPPVSPTAKPLELPAKQQVNPAQVSWPSSPATLGGGAAQLGQSPSVLMPAEQAFINGFNSTIQR